jgi:hypothetical protein
LISIILRPADALLADLQNTVVPSANGTSYKNADSNTSGYGCLKGVKKKETTQVSERIIY